MTAARNFGFVFRSRTPDSITIVEMGNQRSYELLAILDFNNVRKRMSVIGRGRPVVLLVLFPSVEFIFVYLCIFVCVVRSPEGKLSLYCKGADTIIYERLHQSCSKLMDVTTEHLNVSNMSACVCVCWLTTNTLHKTRSRRMQFKKPSLVQSCVARVLSLQEFAGDGLRTLALAYKDLDEEYFNLWKQRHHEASTELEDRERKLDQLYEEIERDLLVGAGRSRWEC